MLDVVDFLEQVGQDAALAYASADELLSGPLAARLSPEQRQMLGGRALPELMDPLRSSALCCMQFPAEEEEEAPEQDEPDSDELPRDGD